MKKVLTLIFALCLMFSGCEHKVSYVFVFDAQTISSVEVYTGEDNANVKLKTVTGEEDLATIAQLMNEIVLGEATANSDDGSGDIGMYLKVNFSDGKVSTVYLGDKGSTVQKNGLTYIMKKRIDVDELWNSLNYEAESVTYYHLPEISK